MWKYKFFGRPVAGFRWIIFFLVFLLFGQYLTHLQLEEANSIAKSDTEAELSHTLYTNSLHQLNDVQMKLDSSKSSMEDLSIVRVQLKSLAKNLNTSADAYRSLVSRQAIASRHTISGLQIVHVFFLAAALICLVAYAILATRQKSVNPQLA